MKANGQAKSRFLHKSCGQNNRNQDMFFGKEAHCSHPKKCPAVDETIGILIAMFGGTVIENRKPERPAGDGDIHGHAHTVSSGLLINAQSGAAESLARLNATPLYKLCEL